jgi:fructokinase
VTLVGGIELGGTKVVCAIGSGPGEILARRRFPTTTPDETIHRAIDFFRSEATGIAAIGIGAFGPLDLDPRSASYGAVAATPKPAWQGTPVARIIETGLGLPVAIATDVEAAGVGEWRWGAARDVRLAGYVTIGTGVGAGIIRDGQPTRGLGHPEFGHVPVARDPDDTFGGVCPFHGDCLEGLASGPAMASRWGSAPDRLPPDHPGWSMEAGYLARALTTLVLTVVPDRIVVGGGVMSGPDLLPQIRHGVRSLLGGYLQHEPLQGDLDGYLVPPALGPDAGVLGAIALASRIAVES